MKTAVALFLLLTHTLIFANEVNLKLPEKIGDLEFIERTDYDTAEAGYSLRYQNDKLLKADVYIYHQGLKGLGNGIDSPAVAQELKNVGYGLKQMQQLGKYRDVKERAAGTKDFGWMKTKFLWTRHSYQQAGEGVTFTGTRISDSFITAYQDHFLKIRITTKEDDLVEDQKVIDAFVLEIAKKIETDQ